MEQKTPSSREAMTQETYIEQLRRWNDACAAQNGTRRRAFVLTFGCQQNEADSEKLRGTALAMGYELTETPADASLIVVNTCAIREHAELKALSTIGQYKHIKQKNPDLIIAVCGCMPAQETRKNELKNKYPYVDLVFGTTSAHRFPELLLQKLQSGKRLFFPEDPTGIVYEGTPVCRESTYRAWVSVMYGCNNFCSYCIVPYVRGHERSRDSAEVLAEVEGLVKGGYKDIMLLGQNVNSYRGDMEFPALLEKCASFEGDYWVRFMTSHPKDASPALVQVMAEQQRVAKHFHLPFQSGNDRILSAMNRKYNREQYLEKALSIKERVKDVSLTSDVIVGFPTETEKEFLDTVELVKQVGFDMLYTFIYSPRKGTVAEKMEGRIPHEEQVRRFSYLSEVQNEIAQKNNDALVGKVLTVLSEGANEKGIPTGRSSGNKIVTFDSPVPAGQFCQVEIDTAKQYALGGKLLK